MLIDIKRLTTESELHYELLLQESPTAMFNHSLPYRQFLRRILVDAEDHYLLAYNGGRLVAALPAFLKKGPLGVVVNSLPFYGSHGGVISNGNESQQVRESLIKAFTDLCISNHAICSTLVEAPIDPHRFDYNTYPADFQDERIGQITTLPIQTKESDIEMALLSLYHQKTRNMVRKGMKSGFFVSHDGSEHTFKTLHTLHDENIRGVGGIAKPWSVFQAIREVFQYDKDYRIYTAQKDGRIVSALLVFFFKEMVEYFTPATLEVYRSEQPLSLLIYTAMKDAIIEHKAKYWNWGGTWLSQDGVYLFKSRWGTTDYPYRYYVRTYRESSFFHGVTKSQLLDKYRYFYTLPFSILEKER